MGLLFVLGHNLEVDHINQNKVDNQRANLRLCTSSENKRNMGLTSRNVSGFKGVYYSEPKDKWRAIASVDRKKHHLGSYDTPEEASQAYQDYIKAEHKEFYCPT
jgi:hypothetical protein